MSEMHELSGPARVEKGFREHLRALLAQLAAEQVLEDLYPGVLTDLPGSPAEAYLIGRRDESRAQQPQPDITVGQLLLPYK